MLLDFHVKNYKSFKNSVNFSLKASGLKNLKEDNIFHINNISLLKSAVLYGANASGKSSLLNAMNEMKSIILLSTNLNTKYIHTPFLLNPNSENEPINFEIELIIDEIIYYYGFIIDKNGNILKEYLEQKKLQLGARSSLLFERDKRDIKLGILFKEGKKLESKTRENALFLSVVAQFNGEIATKILNWFKNLNVLSNLRSEEFKYLSFEKLKDELFREKIINFIKSSDIGIHDIINKKISFDELKVKSFQGVELEELPQEILEHLKQNGLHTIETKHISYNEDNTFCKYKNFHIEMESEGTRKLLALSTPIIETLLKGSILVIDELDNSLHTELVKAIVKLFNSNDTNPNNAQLIFTTHDTNLLNQELFRRDQIYFTQKDIFGISELYSLIDYGVGGRDDLNLEKNYLKGKFGAKPYISSLGLEVK
jgi:AAA15 family ATPase/GTPase